MRYAWAAVNAHVVKGRADALLGEHAYRIQMVHLVALGAMNGVTEDDLAAYKEAENRKELAQTKSEQEGAGAAFLCAQTRSRAFWYGRPPFSRRVRDEEDWSICAARPGLTRPD